MNQPPPASISSRSGVPWRRLAFVLCCLALLAAGRGSAFASRWKPADITAWADEAQAPGEPRFALEIRTGILCGNDPVNRHDPLGLEDLRPDQVSAALAAISGTFTYGGKGIRLGRTYSSLEEIRTAFRSTYMTGALQGMPFHLSSQIVEASDAANQLWAANSCSLQAAWANQQAAQRAAACAMDRRNAAHQQFFSSYPKVLGLTWSMVGAEVLNVGANPLGFGVSADWEYDFSSGKSGVGLSTHEISGGQQAMAIGMLLLPEARFAKGGDKFYRAMSGKEYARLLENGGLSRRLSGSSELGITQDVSYLQSLSGRADQAGKYTHLVEFDVQPGTLQNLIDAGATHPSAASLFPDLPAFRSGMLSPQIKLEKGGVLSVLLGGSDEAVGLFNSSITGFRLVP